MLSLRLLFYFFSSTILDTSIPGNHSSKSIFSKVFNYNHKYSCKDNQAVLPAGTSQDGLFVDSFYTEYSCNKMDTSVFFNGK